MAFIISLIAIGSFAQTQKLTILCRVINEGLAKVEVDYLHLRRLLPDSLQAEILINPKKEHNIDDVLLRMSLNGWKAVTAEANNISTPKSYLSSREIYLSEEEKVLFNKRLADL